MSLHGGVNEAVSAAQIESVRAFREKAREKIGAGIGLGCDRGVRGSVECRTWAQRDSSLGENLGKSGRTRPHGDARSAEAFRAS
jgi:hypothetical protein